MFLVYLCGLIVFVLVLFMALSCGFFLAIAYYNFDEQEGEQEEDKDISLSEIIDNPVFVEFMRDRPEIKELLGKGAITYISINDPYLYITVNKIQDLELLQKTIFAAEAVNLMYNLEEDEYVDYDSSVG